MKPGGWTAQHQITAEVAAACGVSMAEIGRAWGFSHTFVGRRLNPAVNNRYKERNKQPKYKLRHIESSRQWRLRDLTRSSQYRRQYYEANVARVREIGLSWRKKNPERKREARRRYEALKRAGHRHALVPLTLEDKLQRFALWSGVCSYCDIRDNITVDHVVALRRGGLDTPRNVAPACHSCNSSKGSTSVEEWYRRQPFFCEVRWGKLQQLTDAGGNSPNEPNPSGDQ